jgi:uncharacterized membrane protein YqjE
MPESTSTGGLRGALARIGVSFLDLVRTRLELAALEFTEQRERAKSGLLLLLIAVFFVSFAILTASALIVVIFWDTHRLAALAAVAAGHLLIGVIALWRLKVSERSASAPFAQTLAEFERDRQWVTGEARDEAGSAGAAQ